MDVGEEVGVDAGEVLLGDGEVVDDEVGVLYFSHF